MYAVSLRTIDCHARSSAEGDAASRSPRPHCGSEMTGQTDRIWLITYAPMPISEFIIRRLSMAAGPALVVAGYWALFHTLV